MDDDAPTIPPDLGPAPTDPFRLSKHLIRHHRDALDEEAVDAADSDTLRRWHSNIHAWDRRHTHED